MFLTFSAAENKLSTVQSPPVSEDIGTQDQRYLCPLLSFHLAELSCSYFDIKPCLGLGPVFHR